MANPSPSLRAVWQVKLLDVLQKFISVCFPRTRSPLTDDRPKNGAIINFSKDTMLQEQNFSTRVSFLLVFFTALTTGGCALSLAPPKDVPGSLLRDRTVYAPQKPAKAQPLLAVIRFPARVEQRAETLLKKAYREQYFNISKSANSSRGTVKNELDNDAPDQQMIVRSTYFAVEFYEQLRKRLPPNSVALQPMSIDLDEQGHLTLNSPNTMTPAVLYVDFFAYYAPERTRIALPETFGKFMSSVISVHTSFNGSPETFGAIAGMKLIPPSIGGRNPDAGGGDGLRGNLLTHLNDWVKTRCSTRQTDKAQESGDDRHVPVCTSKNNPVITDEQLKL
jgi:hypothetical protein